MRFWNHPAWTRPSEARAQIDDDLAAQATGTQLKLAVRETLDGPLLGICVVFALDRDAARARSATCWHRIARARATCTSLAAGTGLPVRHPPPASRGSRDRPATHPPRTCSNAWASAARVLRQRWGRLADSAVYGLLADDKAAAALPLTGWPIAAATPGPCLWTHTTWAPPASGIPFRCPPGAMKSLLHTAALCVGLLIAPASVLAALCRRQARSERRQDRGTCVARRRLSPPEHAPGRTHPGLHRHRRHPAGTRCQGQGDRRCVFTAYTMPGKDRPGPSLNGGPGASSVYLNMGAIGPGW